VEPFKPLTAVAVPIDMDNVDTDQIIPARLTRKSRREGLADCLFRDLRFNEDGTEKPEFVLNRSAFRKSRIVVASKNYACGSSRTSAIYVHYDYGIRVVIATSIGDAFYSNCFKNGLLAIELAEDATRRLREQLSEKPGAMISIDLMSQIVVGPDATEYRFEIDAFAKRCLLEGLTDVALTLRHAAEIEAFEKSYLATNSWLKRPSD
jgi:3-isopropylmalate/(R)-2-methylmalate dehydratase small subunit